MLRHDRGANKMTKKDYIRIADAISRTTVTMPNGEYLGKQSFLDFLCLALKQDNPNFNKAKFIEACK
jgi:hypothetical protein